MIALGGVIGSGLFLSTGLTLNQAGPGGAVLAYLIGGLTMYLVMLCLGELSVVMPVAGSFQMYAAKFIGPATGFMIGWMYWFSWALTVGLELTSAGILMQRWLPNSPVWVWVIVFGCLLFFLNSLSAKSFGESEFWTAGVKVIAIVLFIILGGAAMFGLIDMKGEASTPLFSHFVDDGGLFPNGITAVLLTMIAVNFSFQGTELIGITAGESENPGETIPKAIKNTGWRIIIFYVLTVVILASLIPWKQAGALESPFVTVLDKIGVPFAADIMNFVILTAMLSVANSALYATTRMLWSLSSQSMASPIFKKLKRNGVPFNALIASLAVAGLSLLSSVFAADTVYAWLLSASGVTAVIVWISISASQFFFRRRFVAEGGKLEDLKFRTPLYPLVPILGFTLNSIVVISLAFIPDQRIVLYCGLPIIAFCYLYYHFRVKKVIEKKNGEQSMGM
ncbi:arginine:proton symporter (AAT family) [Scopulibacillus darangshiensis]|uniref:Arginine:proton symporter (AAT family) n=2 Tax=Scopulibacillus darangshiensis TaxID=442528 RepID=A0A4R2P8L4_9BACL|nr:arginine:proton symporter (AAT family) [Scopulibacillus darangshiensis]